RIARIAREKTILSGDVIVSEGEETVPAMFEKGDFFGEAD
ncbi:unnamed protein product, partial [marine sediment metagenome]